MQYFKRTLGNLLLSCACCCAIFITATPLFGQIDTGGVTGTVIDSTGAIVPNASIKLTNDETAVIISARSTSTGAYSFNAVRPGRYTLQAEAPGFQTVVDKGVEVHLQQTATIDIHLVTGAVSQQVTVTAAAPLLQAESRNLIPSVHVVNIDCSRAMKENGGFRLLLHRCVFRECDHPSERRFL